MRAHSPASGRPGRLAVSMILTAALAGSLAACSGSGSPAGNTSTNKPAATAPPATTPPTTPPASTTSPAAAAGLSGKWSGQYSGAYSGTFTLNWQQKSSKLSGSIDLSGLGTEHINGQVNGSAISFGTVGSQDITYTGSVSGSSMSGSYLVKTPSGSNGGPWNASRS